MVGAEALVTLIGLEPIYFACMVNLMDVQEVLMEGLEPTRFRRLILNQLWLPITPHQQSFIS